MKNSFASPALRFVFSAALISFSSIASAEIHRFNLFGDPGNISIYNGNYSSPPNLPYTAGSVSLSDAVTGLNTIAGFAFNVGDNIEGVVTLGQSLVVPGGAELSHLSINIGWMDAGTSNVFFSSESVTFYENGLQVAPPANFYAYSGSGGALSIGGSTHATPVPSFQFDKIAFNLTVDQILDGSYQNTSSGTIKTGTPWLSYTVTSPVPEPTSALLLIFGVTLLALTKKAAPYSSSKCSKM